MNEVLMETVITKIEMQEKKMQVIEAKFRNQPELKEIISQFTSAIAELKTMLQSVAFPTKEMRELSTHLVATTDLLKQPVEQKIKHHHHLNKGILVAAILFNVVVILIVFLFNAKNQISENLQSDVKYRHLKLSNDKNLHTILLRTDSLYFADPAQMQKDVMKEEERRKEQTELIRQAEEKEIEARQLKEKAKE